MKIEITETSEIFWLDAHHEFSQTELVELSGLSLAELQHLVDCEALVPLDADKPGTDRSTAEARFSADCLALVRAASRLRSDFDLDANGLTLTMRLLSRIHELEAELHQVRAQLPRPAR